MAKSTQSAFKSALKMAANENSYMPKSIRTKYSINTNSTVVIKKTKD